MLDDCNISQPTFSEYRGGMSLEMSEIEELVQREDYSKALDKTYLALVVSDKDVTKYNNLITDDEEVLYEKEQILVTNAEIRWMYIYLLVRNDRLDDAKRELEIYMKDKSRISNIEEAEALLDELKRLKI